MAADQDDRILTLEKQVRAMHQAIALLAYGVAVRAVISHQENVEIAGALNEVYDQFAPTTASDTTEQDN